MSGLWGAEALARRYGGEFSPSGDPRPVAERKRPLSAPKRLNPVGARVNLMFILPFLWAFSAFFRDPTGLVLHLGVFALLLLSAWLTREGVIAQDAYDLRRVARRRAIPRKIFGAVAMGLGLGLAGFFGAGGMAYAVIFGGLGTVLHLGSFGADPLRDKGMQGVDEFQTDRVAQAVEGAESLLKAMSDAILRARDRKLEDRLNAFQTHVRQLLRAVEEDPNDLTSARRYMGVYLQGARDATVKYADIAQRAPDPVARIEYLALLDDLEQNYLARTEALIANDRQSLDIEIDVLRERLDREGLKPRDSTAP